MPQTNSKGWYVYVAQCHDGSYYTGITIDLKHRLRQHNQGQGAKYTRSRRPVALVYSEKCGDHSLALKREWAIKKLTRQQKKQLVKDL